ncbi:hypothetical protein [Thermoleptolyngbya sp. M55_K2018_002]|uniref:hypothetical protein n=1 Tax=Thermoleptolyngbya sp. M55_K2018_002 TaxID=2747808 RepID=UPI001A054FBB|nr:hypothetical protein [Thermoleptolyngbya sp. M55_K2018_002]HIK39951.1 hypothetical protein [Thermoleptolyngbya sp. M55_K2018_002]
MSNQLPPEVRRAIAQFRRADYTVAVEERALRIKPRCPKRPHFRQMPQTTRF